VHREEMRHRRTLVVFVGNETDLGQTCPLKPVDFVPVQRQGEGVRRFALVMAATRNNHFTAGCGQIGDDFEGSDPARAVQNLALIIAATNLDRALGTRA
ncbi:MAG: hypothetical protein ABI478_04465, partial [Propionivibrio sp.]